MSSYQSCLIVVISSGVGKELQLSSFLGVNGGAMCHAVPCCAMLPCCGIPEGTTLSTKNMTQRRLRSDRDLPPLPNTSSVFGFIPWLTGRGVDNKKVPNNSTARGQSGLDTMAVPVASAALSFSIFILFFFPSRL